MFFLSCPSPFLSAGLQEGVKDGGLLALAFAGCGQNLASVRLLCVDCVSDRARAAAFSFSRSVAQARV